jgi:hypothetical protein
MRVELIVRRVFWFHFRSTHPIVGGKYCHAPCSLLSAWAILLMLVSPYRQKCLYGNRVDGRSFYENKTVS